MKLDPFEKNLQNLPWRTAPDSLKDRIFQQASSQPSSSLVRVWFARGLPFGWAAALVLCASLIGYHFGQLKSTDSPAPTLLGHTELRIIETGVEQNFFDSTHVPLDPWSGSFEVSVQKSPQG